MSKDEFLKGLESALAGEVPASVIRENINYYNSYISQEMAKGRTVDEVVQDIGEPRIVARTIIDSCEAAGETAGDGYGSYEDAGPGYGGSSYDSSSYDQGAYGNRENPFPKVHYIDLNKWYWKLLAIVVLFFVVSVVFSIVGGIFALLVRFAGPIFMILLIVWFIRNLRN